MSCHTPHSQHLTSCTDCHRGDPRSSRKQIAHAGIIPAAYARFNLDRSQEVEMGNQAIDSFACRRCHTIGGRGNALASNLDRSAMANAPGTLALAIASPVTSMPQFHLRESMIISIVNALYASSLGATPPSQGEVPQVIYFDDPSTHRDDVFTKHCGSCHRVLTAIRGSLGSGEVAPDLSGLLTDYYPHTARDQRPWNRENLETWLHNPREKRSASPMQPLRLSRQNLLELLDILEEKGTP